jgi:hypothetical protein
LLRAACFVLLLGGCAVQQTATQITLEASGQAAEYVLAAPVELKLNTGYQRSLKQGSRWLRVGRVPQGEVYKPYMDVFTVEGAHIHEAYLVVDGSQLVGFYLPAERSYTNLDQRVHLHFQTKGNP